MKLLIKFFKWLLKPFRKLKRRWLFAKAAKQMEKAVDKQIQERKLLRMEINEFLYDFFGIDANSKYIPKDYKNAEEVRVAIVEKFGMQMTRLNVKYEDMFK